MMRDILHQAIQAGHLREIDLHAARFLSGLAADASPELLLAAALASRAVGDGHICLPLAAVAGREVFAPDIPCRAPDLEPWQERLLASGLAGPEGSDEPLILDAAGRLYLARYYRCEQTIADDLLKRSRAAVAIDMDKAASLIARLFPGTAEQDRQKLAVAAAALKQFMVISGGPGTGKTYTVARILALLQAMAGGTLRIGLVAPTGKAAMRLRESIARAKTSMDDELAAIVPAEAQTLHRLLGFNPGSGSFRYNRDNRLHLDLLAVDEASMIDVPLMAALLEALPEKAGLIMLGDRDQLTSVEAGSLFGDICTAGEEGWSAGHCSRVRQLAGWSPEASNDEESFGDSIALLRASYRFGEKKGIAGLAGAVNRGSREELEKILNQTHGDLVLARSGPHAPYPGLDAHLFAGFKCCFTSPGPGEALAALARFRVLCAVREGPGGVAAINRLARKTLRRHGLIEDNEPWYKGRPLIIRSNHYGLRLFNGDTGVVWPDSEGKPRAWFAGPDNSLHRVPLSRLPEHDTAYAVTVHQAQGSEFDEVLFLLPPADSRVLCRELVYTAVTRARERLVVSGDPELLATAMERGVERHSGLGEKLRQKGCCK